MQNSGKNNGLEDLLSSYKDGSYADFTAKIIPNVPRERILGVRATDLKFLAKKLKDNCDPIFKEAPHYWHDENMLHAYLLCEITKFSKAEFELKAFLPQVNNWAVCDAISPKAFDPKGKEFAKNKEKLLSDIKRWIASKHEYTVRFGISMLMRHFLDAEFRPEYLKWVADIDRDEYYIKMMQAWYFATALAKQWKPAMECLKHDIANDWVRRKAIQKALESRRLTTKQKAQLRKLR